MRRKFRIKYIIIFLILLSLVIIVPKVNNYTISLTKNLKNRALQIMQKKLGRSFKYQNISPNILSEIRINKLQIIRNMDNSTQISFNSISLKYNIIKIIDFLIFKKNIIDIFDQTVVLDGGYISFDNKKDLDLINLFKNLKKPQKKGKETGKTNILEDISLKFRFKLKNTKINIKLKNNIINIPSINALIWFEKENIYFKTDLKFSMDFKLKNLTYFLFHTILKGNYNYKDKSLDISANLDTLETDIFRVKPMSISLKYQGNKISGNLYNKSFNLDINYFLKNNSFSYNQNISNLDFISFKNKKYEKFLPSKVNGINLHFESKLNKDFLQNLKINSSFDVNILSNSFKASFYGSLKKLVSTLQIASKNYIFDSNFISGINLKDKFSFFLKSLDTSYKQNNISYIKNKLKKIPKISNAVSYKTFLPFYIKGDKNNISLNLQVKNKDILVKSSSDFSLKDMILKTKINLKIKNLLSGDIYIEKNKDLEIFSKNMIFFTRSPMKYSFKINYLNENLKLLLSTYNKNIINLNIKKHDKILSFKIKNLSIDVYHILEIVYLIFDKNFSKYEKYYRDLSISANGILSYDLSKPKFFDAFSSNLNLSMNKGNQELLHSKNIVSKNDIEIKDIRVFSKTIFTEDIKNKISNEITSNYIEKAKKYLDIKSGFINFSKKDNYLYIKNSMLYIEKNKYQVFGNYDFSKKVLNLSEKMLDDKNQSFLISYNIKQKFVKLSISDLKLEKYGILSIDITLDYKDKIKLTINKIQLKNAYFAEPYLKSNFDFELDDGFIFYDNIKNFSIDFKNILYKDKFEKLKGFLKLNFKDLSKISIDSVLSGNDSFIFRVFGSVTKKKKLNLNVSFDNLNFKRYGMKGKIDNIGIFLNGSLNSPDITINARSSNFQIGKNKMSLYLANARYKNMSFETKTLDFYFSNIKYKVSNLKLSLKNGLFDLVGFLYIKNKMSKIDLKLDFYDKYYKTINDFFTFFKGNLKDKIFHYLRGSLILEDLPIKDNKLSNLKFDIRGQRNILSLIGGIYYKDKSIENLIDSISLSSSEKLKNIFSFYYSKNGNIRFDIKDNFFVSFKSSGTYKNKKLDYNINNIKFDSYLFPYLLDVGDFKILKGKVTSGHVNLSGNISDPNFKGNLKVSDFYAKTSYIAKNEIYAKSVSAVFKNGKDLNIGYFNLKNKKQENFFPVNVGKSKALANVIINFASYIPSEVSVRVKTDSKSKIHIAKKMHQAKFSASVSNVNLNIVWTYGRLEFKGKGVFQSGELVSVTKKSSDIKTSNKKLDIYLDLDLMFSKNVNFYYPSKTLPLFSSSLYSKEPVNLHYEDEKFTILGDLKLLDGTINTLATKDSFTFKDGTAKFDKNQDGINPIIDIEANYIVNNNGKNDYVKLLIKNQRLKELKPVIIYPDGMNAQDFNNEIQNGIVGQDDKDNSSIDVFTNVISNVANNLINNTIVMQSVRGALRKGLGVDTFSFKTDFVGNMLKDIIKGGAVLQSGNVGDYFNNTSIGLGKFLDSNNNIFFRWDLGVQKSFLGDKKIGASTGFSLELQTPFYMSIIWNYTTTFNDLFKNQDFGKAFLMGSSVDFTFDLSKIKKNK